MTTQNSRVSPSDFQEISRTKARYCRYVDTKQWSKIPSLFTTDARFEGFSFAPKPIDLDFFMKNLAERMAGCTSVHRVVMPDMVPTSPDTARVIWSMTDYNEWPNEIAFPGTDGAFGFRGYGYYEEDYVRSDDTWVISFTRLVRVRMDPILKADTRGVSNCKAAPVFIHPGLHWLDHL
ncbi:nuclear transport factor 2 family protein [Ferrovibrio sp.]|uniref:nuclear transport factor 2 family protein n=1 Tax=Ferrovibrio sp. TaxID=1917215 RepID=UPI003519776A